MVTIRSFIYIICYQFAMQMQMLFQYMGQNLLKFFKLTLYNFFNSFLLLQSYKVIKYTYNSFNILSKMISEVELKSSQIYSIKRNQVLSTYPSVLGPSDSVIYTYTKDATFLRPKEQHHALHFFQGLNTNPQNLSIFLMSQSTYYQQTNQSTKQKITKGIFHVYDIYKRWDCVIEINIPGNLKIYKLVQGKKEIVSSEQIDLMYVSSVLRAFYQKNLVWGRYHEPFKDAKDNLIQLNYFLKILFRVVLKHEIFISEEFEATAEIKGSHSLTLLFRFIKEKRIIAACLSFLQSQMLKNNQLAKSPKVKIFLAEMYSEQGKFSKAIQCTISLAKEYSNDPYVLYYKAKYLHSLLMVDQALQVLHHIVQYNQFSVWTLLARLHIEHKNYIESLVCLNNAAKLSKIRLSKPIQPSWKVFQQIGKVKLVTVDDPIHYYARLNIKSESPLSIPGRMVEEKLKSVIDHPAWKLNYKQKQIYEILQKIFYKMEMNKFQELLKNIFEEEKAETNQVAFRKGFTESMFVDLNTQQKVDQDRQIVSKATVSYRKKSQPTYDPEDQLPNFLKQTDSHEYSVQGDHRNLSIIPQLESVIQNSAYQQRQLEQINLKRAKKFHKRQMNEQFFKILKVLFTDGQFEKAVHEGNYAKVLPVYNKLRNSYFNNNFYYVQMFKIFVETVNYSSIVVLLAEYLDFIEGKGMRKIRRLPYWLENWIFHIIDQKGLIFLNNTINKLNYIDQAVIEAKQNAKKWKIGGVTF